MMVSSKRLVRWIECHHLRKFRSATSVGDMPLSCTNIHMGNSDRSRFLNYGRLVYLASTESLELDVEMRQAGIDETAHKFKVTSPFESWEGH